jgi:hypothetical protein
VPKETLTGGYDPCSASLEELHRRIAGLLPRILRVELRWREGPHAGRTRSAAVGWAVEGEEERSADWLCSELERESEALEEARSQELWFQAVLIVRDGDPIKVPFSLREAEEDPRDATRGLLRVVQAQGALIEKSLAAMSRMADSIATAARPSAENAALELEKFRIEQETKRNIARETAEDLVWAEELAALREIAPKVIAVSGARSAQRDARERGDIPKPAWKHAITISSLVLERCRGSLGPRAVDVFEVCAAATTREEVAQCLAALRALHAAGEIDPFALVRDVPEMLPLLAQLQGESP